MIPLIIYPLSGVQWSSSYLMASVTWMMGRFEHFVAQLLHLGEFHAAYFPIYYNHDQLQEAAVFSLGIVWTNMAVGYTAWACSDCTRSSEQRPQ